MDLQSQTPCVIWIYEFKRYMCVLTHLIRGIGSILKWIEFESDRNTMINGCCCCWLPILVHLFLTQHTNDNHNNSRVIDTEWYINSFAYLESLNAKHSRSIIIIWISVTFLLYILHRDSITLELEFPFRSKQKTNQLNIVLFNMWLRFMDFFFGWLLGWLVLLLVGGNSNNKIIMIMICFNKWSMIAMILISDTFKRGRERDRRREK